MIRTDALTWATYKITTWPSCTGDVDSSALLAVPSPDWFWKTKLETDEWVLTNTTELEITKDQWLKEVFVSTFAVSDEDPGTHYRYTYRQKVTQRDFEAGYVDVNLDPYRICNTYEVGGGPREHIVKKSLRGADKGHTEMELIAELQSCLKRWEEMLAEDS